MSHMPIPTVDVMLVNKDRTKTLLFYRSNKPVQHVWYSLGGRINKNERIEDAAGRKIKQEIGVTCDKPLAFAGIVQEIFTDSMFDGSTPDHPERVWIFEDWVACFSVRNGLFYHLFVAWIVAQVTNSHCINSVFCCEVLWPLLLLSLTLSTWLNKRGFSFVPQWRSILPNLKPKWLSKVNIAITNGLTQYVASCARSVTTCSSSNIHSNVLFRLTPVFILWCKRRLN